MPSRAIVKVGELPKLVARGLIRLYQISLSPFIGSQCRFHPSCSTYALEAIDTHGAVKGTYLAIKRLGRCHPFHPGGFDPVPPAEADPERPASRASFFREI
jgi:putative membrane protein insertion efficiency factor